MSRSSFATGRACLLGVTLLLNAYYLYRCGDGLSPFDGFSEADAVRSAEKYAREGFLADRGLPNVTYGDHYPGEGTDGPSGHIPGDPIYHGYPPGPNWLTGLSMVVFGEGHLARYRIMPVALGLLASAVFLTSLTKTFGGGRAFFVYLACVLAPMFTNLTHDLHFAGYALSLLLLELSALMRVLRRPGPTGPGWLSAVFLLAFLQGWLSFEYAFLVTFAALPMAFLAGPRDAAPDWRKVVALVAACGLGFTLAHGLHFLQSVAYFGGLRGALDEYAFRSGKVYGVPESILRLSKLELLLTGLVLYGNVFLRWTLMFSPWSIVVLAATLAAFVFSRASFTLGRRLTINAVMSPTVHDLAGVVLALGVALGWFFGKPYHALNHLTATGRHLFLFYFACCVALARATELGFVREPAGDREFSAAGDDRPDPSAGARRGQ